MKKLAAAAVVLAAIAAYWHWRRDIVVMLKYYGLIDSYYTRKVKEFRAMPRNEGSIVFLGDSITDFVNFRELLPDYDIANRGIAGDTTSGVLQRLGEVISLRPRKLFLLIGTNDLAQNISPSDVADNIKKIVLRVRAQSLKTKIYMQAVFPTRNMDNKRNKLIRELNGKIRAIAEELHCTFIDLYPLLLDDEGLLAEEYTIDGLHLSDPAMSRWMAYVVPYLDE